MIELSEADHQNIAEQLARRAARRPGGGGSARLPPPQCRVLAVASGKGGVGKSTVAVNLAYLAAASGRRVGIVDADLHGHAVPQMLGLTGARVATPTAATALMEPPTAYGLRVMSAGIFTDPNNAIVWRGPVAHRAIAQFITNANWGELDLLVVDLPPGTGDIAISVANLLPRAQMLVVTAGGTAAGQVAARAGAMAGHTGQRVVGVVGNISGSVASNAGGTLAAAQLTETLGYDVPLVGEIPFDPAAAAAMDHGVPIAAADPESPAAAALQKLAATLNLI